MVEMRVRHTARHAGATVDDVAYRDRTARCRGLPGPPVVLGRDGGFAGPGLLFWHWLDSEAPDGNRTQYVDEAVALAGAGLVSLLPQGRFPWQLAPDNAVDDAGAIRHEVARLRAGLDLLAERPDVDATRLGLVGHDFGGMLATVAAAEDDRLRALVIVAGDAALGDWFLPFWQIADDRIDYLRAMRPLDPIERIGHVGPGVRPLPVRGARLLHCADERSRVRARGAGGQRVRAARHRARHAAPRDP
jgi:hypothetical protein